MYAKYYLQVRDAAEKIRQGSYEGPIKTSSQQKEEKSGFMSRMEKPPEPRPENTNRMIMEYFEGVRRNVGGPKPMGMPVEGDVKNALEALAAVESRGSGDYSAMGPTIESGMYKGDRAYGRYQVMGKNIPSWTKQALGTSLTPEEFLQNPEAQDAVAAYRMQMYYDKHGSWEDAASVWFTGRPLKKATSDNAADQNIDVGEYVSRFQQNWGG